MKNLSLEHAARARSLFWIETVLFAVNDVLPLFDNLLTCFAMYRNHRLHTLPNMFIIALAVSDLWYPPVICLIQSQVSPTIVGFLVKDFPPSKVLECTSLQLFLFSLIIAL